MTSSQLGNRPVRKSGPRPKTIDEIKKKANERTDEACLTTGEVSRLLGGLISRATVTRLFDQGNLDGRVNPMTGERQIKWRAVIEWLKGKGLVMDETAIIEKSCAEEWPDLKRKDKTESV